MPAEQEIPIRNIYWMLCYAWNTLSLTRAVNVGTVSFDHIENLLARVLITAIRHLIKRGFDKDYRQRRDELSLVRGRIDLNASLKKQTEIRRRLVCVYDEFSANTDFNRILTWAIHALATNNQVALDYRRALRKLGPYFSTFQATAPTPEIRSRLMYNRNNQHYRMIINSCEWIYRRQMANEQGVGQHFSGVVHDRQMAALYEKFVFQFYRTHLPRRNYRVSYQHPIDWQVKKPLGEPERRALPHMFADITIDDKRKKQRLIIDTKFYQEALRPGMDNETLKLISAHLYQLYAYLNNDKYSGRIGGMLLYPTVDYELNLNYVISGRLVRIRTLNLAREWAEIEKRLISLV